MLSERLRWGNADCFLTFFEQVKKQARLERTWAKVLIFFWINTSGLGTKRRQVRTRRSVHLRKRSEKLGNGAKGLPTSLCEIGSIWQAPVRKRTQIQTQKIHSVRPSLSWYKACLPNIAHACVLISPILNKKVLACLPNGNQDPRFDRFFQFKELFFALKHRTRAKNIEKFTKHAWRRVQTEGARSEVKRETVSWWFPSSSIVGKVSFTSPHESRRCTAIRELTKSIVMLSKVGHLISCWKEGISSTILAYPSVFIDPGQEKLQIHQVPKCLSTPH